MIRITAKRLLMGNVFKTFLSLLLGLLVSTVGLLLIVVTVMFANNEAVKKYFTENFGEYELAFRIVFGAVSVLFGFLLFSLGKNLRVKKVYETVFGEKTVCSLKKSFRFMLYYCVKFLFSLCWGFIYLLPCAICTAFLVMSLSQGAMEKSIFYSFVTGCAILLFLGLFFTFVTLQRYSAWQYYLCRNEGVVSALYKSISKTKDRCIVISFFKLSMLGWILSCLLIVPIVYVLPYYSISTALFSLDAKENEQEKKREEAPPAVFMVIRSLQVPCRH